MIIEKNEKSVPAYKYVQGILGKKKSNFNSIYA